MSRNCSGSRAVAPAVTHLTYKSSRRFSPSVNVGIHAALGDWHVADRYEMVRGVPHETWTGNRLPQVFGRDGGGAVVAEALADVSAAVTNAPVKADPDSTSSLRRPEAVAPAPPRPSGESLLALCARPGAC